MNDKPKLRAVPAPKLTPPKRCTVRPEWAYPTNEIHRARYRLAIRFLRRGRVSLWLMDIYQGRKS
jgi:hypothetical protein